MTNYQLFLSFKLLIFILVAVFGFYQLTVELQNLDENYDCFILRYFKDWLFKPLVTCIKKRIKVKESYIKVILLTYIIIL